VRRALRLPAALAPLLAVAAVGLALAGRPGALAWTWAAASAAAVAAWDLARLAAGAPDDPEPAREARLLAVHLRALAVGLLPGVALAAALGGLRLPLPLLAVLALGLVAAAALERAAR
jgi:hypothetical protein